MKNTRGWSRGLRPAMAMLAALALGACAEDEETTGVEGGADVADVGGEWSGDTSGGDVGGTPDTGGGADTTGGEDGGGEGGTDVAPVTNTIVDAAVAGGFGTLVAAVQAAGLVETLSGPGPFTVFAPTDAAFAALPAGALDGLLADVPALTEVLLYHTVAGDVRAADVVTLRRATTAAGIDVAIEVEGGTVRVGGATVTATDIVCDNGVIHVLDAVLLPPGNIAEIASTNPDFSTLVSAAQAAGLVDELSGEGPLTVFAPTNAAFAALPAGALDALLADPAALADVLLFHVTDGKRYSEAVVAASDLPMLNGDTAPIALDMGVATIAGARIAVTDIIARNGVIHVLDAVMLPPVPEQPKTLVEIAVGNPDFSTLVTAVQAAGLAEALSGEGPLTVFAPTNAAFAALPAGTLDALLADPAALSQILLYHVASGDLRASDVVSSSLIPMLNGIDAKVGVEGGVASIAGAKIAVTDIVAKNGVIHVLDAVMLPPESIAGIAMATPAFSTLLAAVGAAGLADELAGPGPLTVFAPTNDAFAALPPGTVEALLADIPALTNILLYHVVAGRVPAEAAAGLSEATMLNGAKAAIAMTDEGLTIDGALITMTDIPAANGIIHVLDAVMLP